MKVGKGKRESLKMRRVSVKCLSLIFGWGMLVTNVLKTVDVFSANCYLLCWLHWGNAFKLWNQWKSSQTVPPAALFFHGFFCFTFTFIFKASNAFYSFFLSFFQPIKAFLFKSCIYRPKPIIFYFLFFFFFFKSQPTVHQVLTSWQLYQSQITRTLLVDVA